MKYLIIAIWITIHINLILFGFDETKEITANIKPLATEELLSLAPIKFDFVLTGTSKTKFINITNAGTNAIKVQQVSFANNGLGSFTFVSNPIPPSIIQPKEKITISITFQPLAVNSFFDTLIVEFSEPFFYTYEVPVEGYSYIFDTLWIKDTSAIVGIKDFAIPIFLDGIPSLEEAITCDISFDLYFDNSVFILENENSLPIQSKSQNTTFSTYRLFFTNVVLDKNRKILANLVGKVLLGSSRQTKFEFKNINTSVDGIYIVPKEGTLEAMTTCLSDYSLIEMNTSVFLIDIYPIPTHNYLKINLQSLNQTSHTLLISIMSPFGYKIEEFIDKANGVYELDVSHLPSGIYKLVVFVENQQYSNFFCVIK